MYKYHASVIYFRLVLILEFSSSLVLFLFLFVRVTPSMLYDFFGA